MKKIMRIIVVIICIGLVIGLGYVVSRKLKKYPNESVCDGTNCITDKGMYFYKNNLIYFMDANTGESIVICNKANCKHNSKDCNAYTYCRSPEMLCYDDKIYLNEFSSQIDYDEENDDYIYTASVQIRELMQDGSKEKILYTANEGAISSMQIINGILYFCAWTYHDGFKLNEYHFDWKLYAYDLRWKRLKVLKEYIADDEHDSANLEIMQSNEKNRVYLKYTYSDKTQSYTEVQIYNIAENSLEKAITDDTNATYDVVVIGDKSFIKQMKIIDDTEWMILYQGDINLTNFQEFVRIKEGSVFYMNGYMYLLNSDYNKFFYQYDTGEIYLANTCFTESGTYISDVLDVDESNDRIYIDGHDYTGMKAGDVYYEDVSDYTDVSWTEFRDTYFTKLEDADQAAVAAFDWVKWPEE